MMWLVLVFAAALLNLVLAELFDWFPWIAERIVQRAVRKLQPEVQARYSDEWLAELEAVPGRGLSKLLWSVQVWARAPKVSEAIAGVRRVPGGSFAVKRAIDVIVAGLTYGAFAPLLLFTALAVRLTSRGPVLVRQRRVGRDGKPFHLYKFRSMRMPARRVRADDPIGDTARGGIEGHDRYTAVGRFLRRTSLDELPQLINVVKGEMSLVGPRPERPEFAALLLKQGIVPNDPRDRMKSGITGWAQVQGLRGATSLAERVAWDNYYVANWSLGFDLKILGLTLIATFRSAEE